MRPGTVKRASARDLSLLGCLLLLLVLSASWTWRLSSTPEGQQALLPWMLGGVLEAVRTNDGSSWCAGPWSWAVAAVMACHKTVKAP